MRHLIIIGRFTTLAARKARAPIDDVAFPCDRDAWLGRIGGLYAYARLLPPAPGERPFRAPHHTASLLAMVGRTLPGGGWQPGELALAEGGILYLDQATEFSGPVLEAVAGAIDRDRRPLAGGCDRFRLILGLDPCPCGWSGYATRICVCTPDQIQHHLDRLPVDLRSACDIVRLNGDAEGVTL